MTLGAVRMAVWSENYQAGNPAKGDEMFAESSERGYQGEVVHQGDSIVIESPISGTSVKVSNCFRELIVEVVNDIEPDYDGSVTLLDDDGEIIGDVIHIKFAQNGGITVRELDEIVPGQQWTQRRIVYQEYPNKS
jgi:hypothetical protein